MRIACLCKSHAYGLASMPIPTHALGGMLCTMSRRTQNALILVIGEAGADALTAHTFLCLCSVSIPGSRTACAVCLVHWHATGVCLYK